MMNTLCTAHVLLGLLVSGAAPAVKPSPEATAQPGPAEASKAQIEADWLRQDQVRTLAHRHSKVTPQEDAAGGCDGVKDGKWGFHTGQDRNPWWQVDLGRVMPLDQILIYNRCDSVSERALKLSVLLSADAKTWAEAYRHDGSMFRGATDDKPLSVHLNGVKARFVRIQLPGKAFLHLDEVEVFPSTNNRNVALGKPANQSSTSPWSKHSPIVAPRAVSFPTLKVVERGLKLAADLHRLGAGVEKPVATLRQVAQAWKALPKDASPESRRKLYFQARWAVRRIAFANPLLNFDRLLFVKRVPTSFTHMSDQRYGWFSRPGGGLYILENFKSDTPTQRLLTAELPPGNILCPDISYDATKVIFAHCKYYPGLAEEKNKLDKAKIPEDAFYHLYEMNLDGTGLGRLTRGKYDDFSGRYLPSGEIVFLSTRRGQSLQAGSASASASLGGALPDCYVRCGGGSERPVAVYTLHVMDADGRNPRAISPFENFEWFPSVANDGRILYARWDYIDRNNMPYMSLWSTLPDGSNVQAVFGNFTVSPYCIFEARGIPHSNKLIFTASAHHSITGGSLVLLDPSKGSDGPAPMTRLTPEVPFPEVEAWPATYYANPYPLSEQHYLVCWSDRPLATGWPRVNPPDALGLYLYDSHGNLDLIYRDPGISSMYPLPIRPRRRPQAVGSHLSRAEGQEDGRMLLLDVDKGLEGIPRGTIRRLRIVGIPAKTQPTMNKPSLGITRDDPGKVVLGTVPVEKDGSAYFRVPAGMPFFMQALDDEGMAVQTMRSATYVQPGQTHTCVGCHEQRNTAPPNQVSLAALREPSAITPGPEGSWPMEFSKLVQPVLEKQCVRCHKPGADAPKIDLTSKVAYQTLISFGGSQSLRSHVLTRYRQGRSTAGACGARSSLLMPLLKKGHYEVKLSRTDRDRLITWMDTYAQKSGSFSPEQQHQLHELRANLASMLKKDN